MNHQVSLLCVHCNGNDLIKFGSASNGTQRYRCNKCIKTFISHYTKQAYKPGVKDKIIDMGLLME